MKTCDQCRLQHNEKTCPNCTGKLTKELVEGEDFIYENGLMVFTRNYHLKRGFCCNSGCRHCPYFNTN